VVGAWGGGVTTGLAWMEARDFTLPDVQGRPHSLSDHRGRKALLIAWASWGGCREDLPVWQALYEELGDRGFIPITIALDKSPEDARPYIERAAPRHPALIDSDHVTADLLHIINVPTIIWIDEGGRIVRPTDVH